MRLCILFSFLFLSTLLPAQTNDSKLKGLEVFVNQHNQAYYNHKLRPNETVYSLARFFNVPVSDLLLINKIQKGDNLQVGTQVVIPINTDDIRYSSSRENKKWIPLIYTVKPQETLYRISKMYFPQAMEALITRNNISSFSLKRGRQLIIGYWGEALETESNDLTLKLKEKIKQKLAEKRKQQKTDSPPSNDPAYTVDETTDIKLDSIISEIVEEELTSDTTIVDILEEEIEEPEINYQLGIASWDKAGNDRKNLFVMHNSAKPNSFIRLRYQVTGKEVTAKVLSSIPNNLFAEDIDIVISPAVALALGALDSRFQIQMNYYE